MKKVKLIGIIVAGLFVVGIIGMLLGVEPMEFETKTEEKQIDKAEAVASEPKEDPEPVEKEEATQDKKVEEPKVEKIAKTETVEKEEKAADPIFTEREYYLNEVKPGIQDQLNLFDAAWSELWQPTFEAAGNGTLDAPAAYGNMKKVESHYDLLDATLSEIEGKELSKENKKHLKEFRVNIQSAARWRGEAAKHAKNMFDTGNYNPSQLEKIQEYVTTADSKMLSAVVSLSTIESNLGIVNE